MNLEKKRTNKERSILDEVFVLCEKRMPGKPGYASLINQRVLFTLMITKWGAAFGKN